MKTIWWIRRDLRLADNPTLQAALNAESVYPLFILDPHLLACASPRRSSFLFSGLRALDADLRARGSRLIMRQGEPRQALEQALAECGAEAVYAEEDYTPYARQRDADVAAQLPLHLVQGQLVHHPLAVQKPDGSPYTVYTPFSKTWKALLPDALEPVPAPQRMTTPPDLPSAVIPGAADESILPAGEPEALRRLQAFLQGDTGIYTYADLRNRMDLEGTSALSPYIHFGMLGLPTAVRAARKAVESAPGKTQAKSATTWLNELIWREFYIHILYHYPHVRGGSFRPQYDRIRWRSDQEDLAAWQEGRTGYPVVDAAMRQLRTTGWMHNRARMIAASFLVKDLLIDWRLGERWFMAQLLDADLAANNGGWQWTAGTGTDAAPYFRIFNPILQSKKFDPQGEYIRRWVPELALLGSLHIHAPWEKADAAPAYPQPLVDHAFARQRTLEAYRNLLPPEQV